MDEAGLEPGGGEGPLDGEVVAAGPLDGDDEVAEAGSATASRIVGPWPRVPRGCARRRWRYEDAAVEVGEHPFGAGLGAVDGDDAEVLGPDGLDPGVDGAEGLVDDLGAGRLA